MVRRVGGFSITEVTTILTMMSILSAAAMPAVDQYVEEAKLVRATHDVRTLAVVLTRFFNDIGSERNNPTAWTSYNLLVGTGAAPAVYGDGTDQWGAAIEGGGVGLVDDHLITNTAGYTPRDPGAWFGWRGAYLQQVVQPDPWGNRYGVNVQAMREGDSYTVVLSAGPNGVAETPFGLYGLPAIGDDIVAVVSSMGAGHGRPTVR